MKKLTALLLAVILLLPAVVPHSRAAGETTDSIEEIVGSQYEAYARSKARSNADSGVVTLFWKHALNGGNIVQDENSDLASAVLNSVLFKAGFVDSVSRAISRKGAVAEEKIFLRSNALAWYEHKMCYRHSVYRGDETVSQADDKVLAPLQTQAVYLDGGNENDNVLMLIGGWVESYITLKKVSMTDRTVTYDVSVKVWDRFDFNGSYDWDKNKGMDTGKAELLTYLGKLMGLEEFDWSVEMDGLRLTVPFSCDHVHRSYSWTFEDTVASPVTEGGHSENYVEPTVSLKDDGTVRGTYYELGSRALLRHDMPWSVEFTAKGQGNVYLCSSVTSSLELPYFLRTATSRTREDGTKYTQHYLFVGKYVSRKINLVEMLKLGLTKMQYSNYERVGIDYSELFDKKLEQTFRYENHVFADGTNAIHVYVDGVDQGAIQDRHLYAKKVANVYWDTVPGWSNGMDLDIGYIGNKSIVVSKVLKSLTICEGDGPGDQSAFQAVTVASTCDAEGYTEHTCRLCGYSYRDSYTPALGHRYTTAATAPTCTEEGFTTYTCTACGGSHRGDYTAAAGHSYSSVLTAPTCTAAGYTTHTCTVCGSSHQEGQTDPLGHRVEHGTITWAADCLSAESRAACVDCGHEHRQDCAVTAAQTGDGELTITARTQIGAWTGMERKTVTAQRQDDAITVTLPGGVNNLQVLVGHYDAGRMLSTRYGVVEGAKASVPVGVGPVKLFFLDRTTWMPLLPALSLN